VKLTYLLRRGVDLLAMPYAALRLAIAVDTLRFSTIAVVKSHIDVGCDAPCSAINRTGASDDTLAQKS